MNCKLSVLRCAVLRLRAVAVSVLLLLLLVVVAKINRMH
jgi:hypothetical protein